MLERLAPLDARIPNWAAEDIQERPCPFCGSSRDPVLMRPDGLLVAHCDPCGLWFNARAPTEQALGRLYRGYWHRVRPADLSRAGAEVLRRTAEAQRANDVRVQRLRALLGGFGGRRVLDVGCGTGLFLLAARAEGADVIGQDVAPETISFLREHLGVAAIEGPLEGCGDSVGKVDVVVMNDLIEHPLTPDTVLDAALTVLNPGGLLLLWTPNGGGAGTSVETARRWVGFRVDLEHMQYLSAATIVQIAQRRCLEIEHLETLGFPNLDAIERLPSETGQPGGGGARRSLWGFTGTRRLRRMLRRCLGRDRQARQSPREGTYHLFAVLRKRGGRSFGGACC